MPWKVNDVMTERMRFILRHQDGERMTDLCKEFEISRKTGYKFLERYKKFGAVGLEDRPPVARNRPHRTPPEIRQKVVALRRKYPTWGPKKLKDYLEKKNPGVHIPAASTITELLRREGLVKPRRRRRRAVAFGGLLWTARKAAPANWHGLADVLPTARRSRPSPRGHPPLRYACLTASLRSGRPPCSILLNGAW